MTVSHDYAYRNTALRIIYANKRLRAIRIRKPKSGKSSITGRVRLMEPFIRSQSSPSRVCGEHWVRSLEPGLEYIESRV